MKRRTTQVAEPALLAVVVGRALAVPEPEAAALVKRGAVYVEGKRVQVPGQRVPQGARVSVVLEEAGAAAMGPASAAGTLHVLFEDEDQLVVNKATGMAAQPTASRVGDSLLDQASAYLRRPAGLVHRLDKDTSGVVVFGKTPAATSALAAAFRGGQARKRYLAATGPGLLASGVMELPLSKDPTRPGRWRATARANGVSASTRYERLYGGDYCLVALFPETGRTHQLRAHLASEGHPILGDRLYGGGGAARCLLHAQGLEVLGRRFEAPLPDDLAALFEAVAVEPPSGPW